MASSNAFEWLSAELESGTDLDRLEARGTVRLALRRAGLEAGHLTGEQLRVVLESVMPGELSSRGIQEAAALCSALVARLCELPEPAAVRDSPEAVFGRMA